MTYRMRRDRSGAVLILGATLALGAAVLSLGMVPSLRRYLRMKSM